MEIQDTEEKDSVLCSMIYEIYCSQDNWCAVRYLTDDGHKFTAIGTDLPRTKNVKVILYGKWVLSRKDGTKQFNVDYYETPKQTDKSALIAYMEALKCGIGRVKAEEIYKHFGDNTWDVFEENPWELTHIKGISIATVEKFLQKRKSAANIKELIIICKTAGVEITSFMINNIIRTLGENAIEQIKSNPYILTDQFNISFDKSDAIARMLNIPENFEPRLEAGVHAVFSKASLSGHTCLPKKDIQIKGRVYHGIIYQMQHLLGCSEKECQDILNKLWKTQKIKGTVNYIYTRNSFEEEQSIASDINRLLRAEHNKIGHLEYIINDYEDQNFILSDCQREAVRMVFRSQISVITGGPGTGKTTVIKAVLYTHQQVFGESSDPVLLAPTGKASRRMSEATGFHASTVHAAVGFRGDELEPDPEITINGNLIIIDEASMLDQNICALMLRKVNTGAKVVFVGDINQLPSVGAGNILKDIIESGMIPMTKLNVIYRQKGESPIITNAAKMNRGETDLVFNQTFKFYDCPDDTATFERTKSLYIRAVKGLGIENVILLNPQRQNSLLSVGAFNRALQQILHSEEMRQYLTCQGNNPEFVIRVNGTDFREGDRVMQMKNTENARNGDIGVIQKIEKKRDQDDPNTWQYMAYIEFNEDGKMLEYNVDDMRKVDLAYASTIHKTQGSEYKCVIEVVSLSHPSMQKRQIIYTGITRAKSYVYLVGQKKALINAIMDGEPDIRHTLLAQRLNYEKGKRNA